MSSIVESTLPQPVAGQRIEYWEWIEQHAVPSMRDTLIVLREHWCDCNESYFDGRMVLPYITLTEPSAPTILGQCCSVSSWGSRLEIKLRPSLLVGTHPMIRRTGISAAGRLQLVKDVLLHEMIHQHVMEHEPDVNEESYHGHGPVFAAHCNRIGAELGLDEVVVRNRKGSKSAKSPQWPHCVAPPDRYGAPLRWRDDHQSAVTDSGDAATMATLKPIVLEPNAESTAESREEHAMRVAARAVELSAWGRACDGLLAALSYAASSVPPEDTDRYPAVELFMQRYRALGSHIDGWTRR